MSRIVGKEGISYSKEEAGRTRGSLLTSKTVIFKDERSQGDLVINTQSLNMPSEAGSNGFVQPGTATLNALNLLFNRKNLKVHSSRGVWLQEYEDYIVTGASTIQLIGNIKDTGGALEGEVFTVYATPVQTSSLLTTDAKKQYQEYVLPDGQTTLNLGREYEVGANITAQIGSIRIFRNGVGPLLRNVANAAAAPLADGNYHEVNDGTGRGTQVEFNVAPSGQDDVIVVEFGLEYAGDLSIVGDIESLYGGLLALANDVGPATGNPVTNYLTANPSQVERRGFGDSVLDLLKRVLVLETYQEEFVYFQRTQSIPDSTTEQLTSIVASKDTKGGMSSDRYIFQRSGSMILLWRAQFGNNSTAFRSFEYTINDGASQRILSTGGISSTATTHSAIEVIEVNAGDFIKFFNRQATGSPENVINRVAIFEKGNTPLL